MAKFVPSEHVERIEYDFTEYGGGAGVIPEPTTKKVNDFFHNMKVMVREVQVAQKALKDKAGQLEDIDDIEELDDERLAGAMDAMDEVEGATGEYQRRTMENIAVLCGGEWVEPEEEGGVWTVSGGSPDLPALQTLPFRALQAFSTWLVKEIQPKKTAPGTRR